MLNNWHLIIAQIYCSSTTVDEIRISYVASKSFEHMFSTISWYLFNMKLPSY